MRDSAIVEGRAERKSKPALSDLRVAAFQGQAHERTFRMTLSEQIERLSDEIDALIGRSLKDSGN